MTADKPLLQVLAGASTWPPPIWLMRQAGRYLPEYRQLRAKAGDFLTLCLTSELAAEATMQPIRRYRMDAAILFSDILLVPWALGRGLEYREGEGPILPPLRAVGDVAGLEPGQVLARVGPVLQTVRLVRSALSAEGFADVSLIGFAGGPFTVACYMVEGGGSRDFPATRRLAFGDPVLFARLLDVLTDATVVYLEGQIAAGAEAVMLFDSWAGILSPSQFRAHVIRTTRRIVAELGRRCPGIPVIGFPRLAGALLAAYAAETGVHAIGLDTSSDLVLVRQAVGADLPLQGNLDPLAVAVGGGAMVGETAGLLHAMRGRPSIFNLGHGLVPETPPEHVAALVEFVRAGRAET